MTEAAAKSSKGPRAQPREVRRDQLIRATMACIAQHGLSGTTMAQVTKEAGLSLGIANLHFESKEKMLLETLRYVTSEYNRGLSAILDSEDYDSIADKLEAVVKFDFSPRVTERKKMAVWFAFYGEAKSRPTYQRICSRNDFMAEDAISTLFQAAIDEADYPGADAALLASGYTALIDGLWLNLLVAPRHISISKAARVARHYLASAFPNHLSQEP